jgi:hypothetical protein
MSRIPDHIENPSAYAAAIDRNIKMNAWKGKRERFAAAEPELYAALEDLWNPKWNPEVEEWQQDGSHMILHTMTNKERNTLLRKMSWLRDGYDEWGSLTDGQAAKAKEIISEARANIKKWEDEDELRKLNATPWTEGRQEFRCTVVSAKVREVPSFNPYDRSMDIQLKMIVQREDGSRLWCTAPSKLAAAVAEYYDYEVVAKALRGAELTLRVTVEPSGDDPIFAFGKRPHLVELHAAPNKKEDEDE